MMNNFNLQIDHYIDKSEDFAKPILSYLRDQVHGTLPYVEEKIKWGFPAFEYKGPLCHMAAFKAHCAFGFHKAPLIIDKYNVLSTAECNQMSTFGKIHSIQSLPSIEILKDFLLQAADLNEKGIKLPRKAKKENNTSPVEIPEILLQALKRNPVALANFESMAPSHRKEYVNYILEAKQETTRLRRVERSIERLIQKKNVY